MTKLNIIIVFYIHLESLVFLLMYNFQDSIGPDNVFYTIHTLYAVFDLFIVVWAFTSQKLNTCTTQQLQKAYTFSGYQSSFQISLVKRLWAKKGSCAS